VCLLGIFSYVKLKKEYFPKLARCQGLLRIFSIGDNGVQFQALLLKIND
jgi:hypothetical protein